MYSVGQVLFIILNKKQQVIPVQVTEQVVRRTLGGEETTYSVAIPGREGFKSIELNQVDGDVFESIEAVREQMFAHARDVINTISEKALNVAKNRFDYRSEDASIVLGDVTGPMLPEQIEPVVASNREPQLPLPRPTSSYVKVELSDGTLANVSIPDFKLTGD